MWSLEGCGLLKGVVSDVLLSHSIPNQVAVGSKVASYLPIDSSHLSRPSERELAQVLQVVFQSGRIGDHRINSTSYAVDGERLCVYTSFVM